MLNLTNDGHLSKRLAAGLTCLSPVQREIVERTVAYGESYEDVAVSLGMAPGEVLRIKIEVVRLLHDFLE